MYCCIDLSIAVRMIAFYGLVVGAIAMIEIAAEYGENQCACEKAGTGELSAGVVVSTWLLGLSVDEFGSGLRHSLPAGKVDGHGTPDSRPEHLTPLPMDNARTEEVSPIKDSAKAVKQILSGFLVFSVAYAMCSVLLMLASIYNTCWMVVPWLVAHLVAISARMAIVVSQLMPPTSLAKDGVEDYPQPGVHLHETDQGPRVPPAMLVASAANLTWLFFTWTVVVVAGRTWWKRQADSSPVAEPGDESFGLYGEESFVYLESLK